MIPDPTVALPTGFDTPPAVLRDAIGKITASDASASIPKAIRAALTTLATARQPQRELHILTDLQQKNWSRGEVEAQPTSDRITIHRIESTPLSSGSVSLDATQFPTRAIPAGRVTPVRVVLENHGPAAAHVRLNSADDSGKNFEKDADVAPNASTPVVLTFSFPNPGFHWAQIWVEGDAAPTANRAHLGFWTTDVKKVLFAGGKDDFAALPYAISPGGNADLSGIETDFASVDQLPASLATKPLAVVLTWESWPQDGSASQALQDYVRAGGTLFLVPAPDTGISIPPPAAPWLDASVGATQTAAAAEPVMLLQDGDGLWRDLRDADGRPKLGLLRAFKYRLVKMGAQPWQVLISSAKGGALLARRDLDHGRIFASGLAFSPKWSSLPLKGGFVVLMQNAVFGDQAEHIPVQNIHAGDDFHFDFPGDQGAVKSLAGGALDWHGEARDFEGLPRAGVYEIDQRDHVNWVATSGNPDEADPHFLPSGQVPLLRNLPHEVVALASEDDINRTQLSQTSGTSLYRWLLLIALLLLLAETWLANERSSDLGKKLFSSMLSAKPKKTASPKRAAELTKV